MDRCCRAGRKIPYFHLPNYSSRTTGAKNSKKKKQVGGELPVFRGFYQRGGAAAAAEAILLGRRRRLQQQHGRGLGSFFAGLWRTIRPLVMPAAKAVGKELL